MPQHVYMLLSVKNSPYNYYVSLELLFHIEKTIYIQFKRTKIQILLSNLRKLFDNFVKHLAPRRTDLIGEMASLCFPTFNEMLVKT